MVDFQQSSGEKGTRRTQLFSRVLQERTKPELGIKGDIQGTFRISFASANLFHPAGVGQIPQLPPSRLAQQDASAQSLRPGGTRFGRGHGVQQRPQVQPQGAEPRRLKPLLARQGCCF